MQSNTSSVDIYLESLKTVTDGRNCGSFLPISAFSSTKHIRYLYDTFLYIKFNIYVVQFSRISHSMFIDLDYYLSVGATIFIAYI